MATYYTKCGRTFEKSSTAVTTGYRMADDDIQCHGDGAGQAQCPFRMDVKEGWPPVHKCWECRAGSKPPNHATEWTGSLEDKNTIQIHSLDVALMEEIMSYCEAHPALGAAYNTDHLDDCRRTIAVHCISNKTGIAAKKELIAKFFPVKEQIMCKDCIHRMKSDTGEGHPLPWMCINAAHRVGFDYYFTDGCEGCSNFNKKVTVCEESPTNIGSDSCAPGTQTDSATSTVDKETAMTAQDSRGLTHHGLTCATCQFLPPKGDHCNRIGNDFRLAKQHLDICDFYHNNKTGEMGPAEFKYQYDDGYPSCKYQDFPDDAVRRVYYTKPDVKKPSNNEEEQNDMSNGLCILYGHDVDCWKRPDAPKHCAKEDEMTCHYFSENEQKHTESDAFLPENVSKTGEIVSFDYSSVDEETGAFLQEKANNILQIRTAAMIRIAKELSEAHDILANNKTGTFTAWCRSIGYLPDTAQNYVRAYKYIAENFGNIEDAENIQQSLLFAVSKPSARPELQQAVLAGDIKTHKEYQELEKKLKETEFHYDTVKKSYKRLEEVNNDHYNRQVAAEKEVQKLKAENRNTYEAYQKDMKDLRQQIDQARRNSDPAKVHELGQIISDKQKEIEDLRQQLKDKPIEATAARVVEKLPDDVQEYLSSVNDTMRHMQNFAKVNQVLNLVVGLSTDELQSWAAMMNNRKAVNDDDESETLELLGMAIQSLEDMKEDYESRGCE